MKKQLLIRCTCPNCDGKYVRQITEEEYELASRLAVENNRILLICDRCDNMIQKALMKMRPDPV